MTMQWEAGWFFAGSLFGCGMAFSLGLVFCVGAFLNWIGRLIEITSNSKKKE